MKKDTNEMLEILHKNHEKAQLKDFIEKGLEEDRKRFEDKKEKKAKIIIFSILALMIIGILTINYKLDQTSCEYISGNGYVCK